MMDFRAKLKTAGLVTAAALILCGAGMAVPPQADAKCWQKTDKECAQNRGNARANVFQRNRANVWTRSDDGNARSDVFQRNRADVQVQADDGDARADVYQRNRANVWTRSDDGSATSNVYQSNNANVNVRSD
jgi:hypothetical protein